MSMSPLISGLRRIITERLTIGEPMSRHTSWRIGGPAEIFCQVNNLEELSAVTDLFRLHRVPWRVLGGGTNILVADQGLAGAVVKLGSSFRRTVWDGTVARAGAGVFLSRLSRQALDHSLSGLEFAAGIPGTLGGAVVGNAGTPLGSMSDIVKEVVVLEPGRSVRRLGRGEIGFEYRGSDLKKHNWTVLEAVLELVSGSSGEIRHQMETELEARRRKQPWQFPCAGSVFKNPSGDHAGRLIEAVGLKGVRRGDAQFSEVHANFIVNLGQASAQDVLGLIQDAKNLVLERFGVHLEEEILYWG